MKDFLNTAKKNAPWWVSVIMVAGAFVWAVVTGGRVDQTVETPKGCLYRVHFDLNEDIMSLIEECKIKDVGDVCFVEIRTKIEKLADCEVKEDMETPVEVDLPEAPDCP